MTNPPDAPAPRPGRACRKTKVRGWPLTLCVAGGLLLLQAATARAVELKPGGQYRAVIAACGTRQDAETLRGFVVSGDLDRAHAYLQADDNSCGAGGPIPFVVLQQVGDPKTDARGNAWKIVEIALPAADAYLLTSADLAVGRDA